MKTSSKFETNNSNYANSYEQFQKLQKYRHWLCSLCDRLLKTIDNPSNQYYQKDASLIVQLKDLSRKLRSQRFRVAVIGEFSQGKSTLINALVKKEIQPVRAIACSGTLTVLRYGTQQRILCHYKDGRREEISYEQYRVLSTISKDAARQDRSDEFYHTDIEEIIFEHPDFDLCQTGVEIVDSPGLNEHPERAEITRKLIKDADALIFITDASQALAQTERQLIQEIRRQINLHREDKPLTNLFLLVNKIDNLDSEEDLHDVQAVVNEFAYGKNPMLAGAQRVHYISAKSAFKAIINNTEHKCLDNFYSLVKAVENFLVSERGFLEIKPAISAISQVITEFLTNWDEIINTTEMKKKELIEKIGDQSGYCIKIQSIIEAEIKQINEIANTNFRNKWHKWTQNSIGLYAVLDKKSKGWYSVRHVIWDQHGIIKDYTEFLVTDLKTEVNAWINKEVMATIKSGIKYIEKRFYSELKDLYKDNIYNNRSENQWSQEQERRLEDFDFDVSKKDGYGDFFSWIFCILFIGYFVGTAHEIVKQMKYRVIKEGIEKLRINFSEDILEDISKKIHQSLQKCTSVVDDFFTPMLTSQLATLEQKQSEYIRLLEKKEEEVASIAQYQQELEALEQQVKSSF